MKILILALLISHSFLITGVAMASKNIVKDAQLFQVKQNFEEQAFQLKIKKEKEMIEAVGKIDFNFINISSLVKQLRSPNMSCAQWVYRGSASREEAMRACRGVRDMKCVEWVYRGSASRVESASACRGRTNMECTEWVYRGSAPRLESVHVCRGVRDMSCVEWVYRGSASRVESAQACQGGGRRPDRPGCK